jgi:hypothetical protein
VAWPWGERAAEVAEQFCEGLADHAALERAQAEVQSRLELHPGEPVYNAGFWACGRDIADDVGSAAFYAANLVAGSMVEFSAADFDDKFEAARRVELRGQGDLLRDIFGNPFHPVALDPSWLTPTVIALSQATYAERHLPSGRLDPARLAILADALEEAGCEDQTTLHHLRGPGSHVRGCWVVDLLLGKE